MKKITLIITLLVFAVLAFTYCNSHSSSENKISHNAKTTFTCTMHPEVQKDEPGNCPKCGMELIEKEIAISDTSHKCHH